MTPRFTNKFATKAVSLAFAAVVTLSIMTSLDTLARTEQTSSLAAANSLTQTQTQTACVAPARRS